MKQNFTPASAEDLLISHLVARERTAIGQLYDMYAANMSVFITRIVKDKMIAEDVMQDCFIKIWNSVHLYIYITVAKPGFILG
jgi:RNA polymerase sigma-70 factor (ECF subfamily)